MELALNNLQCFMCPKTKQHTHHKTPGYTSACYLGLPPTLHMVEYFKQANPTHQNIYSHELTIYAATMNLCRKTKYRSCLNVRLGAMCFVLC